MEKSPTCDRKTTMGEYEAVANAIGDSFLNRCWSNDGFLFTIVRDSYTALFGWSEPYPLLVLVLLMLVILPSIFSIGSKSSVMKISRIYSFVRLGAMSILHQIGYSYTFADPVAGLIGQSVPCRWASETDDSSLAMMPSSLMTSSAMFAFAVARFSGVSRWISMPICLAFLTLNVTSIVAVGFNTVFQAVTTVFISYILHFIHVHIPFRLLHFENLFWTLLIICAFMVLVFGRGLSFVEAWSNLWFGLVVIGIDELMLWRHQITRGGFSVIERPGDIYWSGEVMQSESVRLLNSEEEDNFSKNMRNDIYTSIAAFAIFFVCVLLRKVLVPNFFTTVTTG